MKRTMNPNVSYLLLGHPLFGRVKDGRVWRPTQLVVHPVAKAAQRLVIRLHERQELGEGDTAVLVAIGLVKQIVQLVVGQGYRSPGKRLNKFFPVVFQRSGNKNLKEKSSVHAQLATGVSMRYSQAI